MASIAAKAIVAVRRVITVGGSLQWAGETVTEVSAS